MIDSNGIVTPDTPKKQAQFTTQAKRSHVQSFETSSQTMTAYCEKHEIPISTFSTWRTKYGKTQSTAFVPMQVKPEPVIPPKVHAMQAKTIEIHRGDLKVVFPMIDVAMTVEIIKGVLTCS